MSKRFCGSSVSILAAFFAAHAMAQTMSPPSAERLELARQLFEVNGMAAESKASIERMVGATIPQPALNPVAGQVFQRHLPELMRAFENVYAEAYSPAELRELIAFYKTPIGRTMVAKGPQIARESMRQTLPLIMAMSVEAASASRPSVSSYRCDVSPCPPPPPLYIRPIK